MSIPTIKTIVLNDTYVNLKYIAGSIKLLIITFGIYFLHMVLLKGNVALTRNYFARLSKTCHSSLDNLVYACA